jgi:hypothetical protein
MFIFALLQRQVIYKSGFESETVIEVNLKYTEENKNKEVNWLTSA